VTDSNGDAVYPMLPSTKSHAVLARKRSDCVHFYGGPSPVDDHVCSSSEHM
jgi:hypothetical protein